jgi:glycosyltransferase involved in cell wall biosynthesis
MKIALFVHCFYPDHFYGTETYTLQVARRLRELGHQPVVVSAVFQGEPRRNEAVTRYEYDGLPVICIDKNFVPHAHIRETYYQESMRPILTSLLNQIKPDVVHVMHLINHTAVLLDVAAELKLPIMATLTDFFGFCYTNKLEAADGELCSGPNTSRSNCVACFLKARASQSDDPKQSWSRVFKNGGMAGLGGTFLTQASRIGMLRQSVTSRAVDDLKRRPDVLARAYRNYRAVVTPTRFLQRAYEVIGLDVKAFNVRFGVDISRMPKTSPEQEAPVRFGFIGQLAPHKGADLLLEAFKRLPIGTASLLIYGPEDQVPSYSTKLRQLALGHDISFCGTFPEERTRAVLDTFDVLVIPSRWYENSPLVLLNALASHTPVVVADVAGLTEFVEEGKSGYSFVRGSADSLFEALRRFVETPNLAAMLSLTTEYLRTTQTMVDDLIPIYTYAMENQ